MGVNIICPIGIVVILVTISYFIVYSALPLVGLHFCYRSGTVTSKSFVGKVFASNEVEIRIKLRPVIQILTKTSN